MTKSVLLVEDEESIAIALSFLIERQGYELTRVSSGTAALEAVRTAPPDLVLLDVMLPGCTGYEVCQTIRLDPALAATKILMITAKGGDAERRKSLSMGADAFMAKPFSTTELTGEVRRLLEEEHA